uniref:glycosyltransferase n=1 Tax=uncultured Lutibacter sp. TaxID=437739 RepID=UPI002627CCE3
VGYLFLDKKKIIDVKALNKLKRYITEHKITIIHAHSSSYFTAVLVKFLIPKIKIVWHNHYGNAVNLTLRKILPLKFASYFFKSIISVNTMLNDWAKLKLKAAHNYYLPNFAVLDANILATTNLKGAHGKRIVCLANLRPEKDHINLLKAFQRVNEIHSDWTLHLVGLAIQDTYATEIKEYIVHHKLSNHVFLYGSCYDTSFILEQASIGVLASKSEGLPVALLEYGLAKLPVVVTDVGECAKVVKHKRSGMVVAPNNEVALAKALEMLVLDKKLCSELSTTLYETVQMNYSKSNFIQTLIAIYNLD